MVFRNDYYFLSNMYLCEIKVRINNINYTFSCVEAAYQACKCPQRANEFLNIDGYKAKEYSKRLPLREDWENIKLNIMETLVRAKFTQNKDLKQMLIDLNEEIVEENYWNDIYWGTCNGKGENHLGKILTKIRSELISPKITIGTFKDINGSYDEIWAIVRSLKRPPKCRNTKTKVLHVPELSPSSNLFSKYLKWKSNDQWSEETFKEEYVPQFLKELHNKQSINLLNTLYKRQNDNKNILLICYCQQENLCHRSIICGLLQGVGIKVNNYNNTDYSHYYKQY